MREAPLAPALSKHLGRTDGETVFHDFVGSPEGPACAGAASELNAHDHALHAIDAEGAPAPERGACHPLAARGSWFALSTFPAQVFAPAATPRRTTEARH